MFGDTIALTVGGVGKTLNKVNQDNFSSDYLLKEATGQYRLRIRHQLPPTKVGEASRERANAELIYELYATPTTAKQIRKSYIVIEQDSIDSDTTLSKALLDWLLASSAAALTKLRNRES